MLSPADRAICDRDHALPGLPAILDASALAMALGLPALAPAYLRYKPGVSCTAAFRNPDGGVLAAHAYPPDRYSEFRRRPKWSTSASVRFLDTQCLVMMPARFDRDLRALRRVLDPRRQEKYLGRIIGRHEDVGDADIEILRYKPGRRLVARIDRDGAPCAVLKVIGAGDFNGALIGATGAAAHGGASLLGASHALRALVTGWVEGRSICPEALSGAPDVAVVSQVGAALARLHEDPLRPAASVRPADDARALAAMAEDLVVLDATLGRRTGALADAIAVRLRDAGDATTLVHGDFSADQVIMTDNGPVIIDWDQAACGDPARDLGCFLARLDAQAADGILTRTEAEDLGAALVEGYARSAGAVPDSLVPHHARGLVMLASEGFRLRHESWPERGAMLLDRAAALLSRPTPRLRDPDMPALDAALDGRRIRPQIAEAMGEQATSNLRIAPPELLRHKPGRRALVRYRLDGAEARSMLGKIRAKGPDRHTPQVHQSLRAAGLDGCADHGVGVPRVLGRIDALNMWLQEEIPGEPLSRHFDPRGSSPEVFARTGAALARLHDLPPSVGRPWSLADEARVLDGALVRAAKDLQDQGEALDAIRRGARVRLQRLAPAETCVTHRDFYFDQVHVSGARIWLLDLDLVSVGDPSIDIGNFLAHLDEYGLRRFGDPDAFDVEAAAFLVGYDRIRARPAANRIATLRAISLARHIHISIRFETRRHVTERLISLSLAALDDEERMSS